MSQVFIFENATGAVLVGTPTAEALQTLTIEQIAAKDTPVGADWYIVDTSSLPIDSAFSGAWVFTTPPNVVVDISRAQDIYKQTADSTAASLSTPLTQEYMRLTAIDADTTAVKAQLKAINAAAEETAYLDATTVPQLIACWPPELGPNPFLPFANNEAV